MAETVWPLPKEGEPDAFTLPPSDRPDPKLVRTVFVHDSNTEEEMVETIRKADCYAVDTEGTGLRIWQDKIIGICISVPPWKTGFYCPAHNGPEGGIWYREQRTFDRRIGLFKEWFENDVPKRFFNMLYDVPIIYTNFGIVVQDIAEDVMLKCWALNPDAEHGLKESAVCYIDPNADWYEAELHRYNAHVGGSPKKPRYWLIPPWKTAEYGGADAVYTGQMDDIITPLVDPYALKNYYAVTMKLAHALLNMRIDGVPLHRKYLERGSVWCAAYMSYLVEQMRELIGDPTFSPTFEQLNDVLYNRLQLPKGRATKKGFSTDEDEIKRLRGQHPIIDYMAEYRTVEKQKGSYCDALVADMDERDRFCPDPKINGTVLGRLSLNRLHQIPRGALIRHAFVAGEGRKLVGGDYSQMDARVLAHLSRDPKLVDAYRRDLDIHSVTAKDMFNLPYEIGQIPDVCPVHGYQPEGCCARHGEYRDGKAKQINFALFTGEGVYGLQKQLECSREEAHFYHDSFWLIYTGIRPWKDDFVQRCRRERCVRTIYNRPRYVPGIERSLDGLSIPRRYPHDRPSCYAKQARFGGLALALRYDMGIDLRNWTSNKAESMRPLLVQHGNEKCSTCKYLWDCYYTVDYRIEQRAVEEIYRQIVSTAIQGSTADLVNDGVARAWEMCRINGYSENIHLFVHDESVYSVPVDSNIDLFCQDLKKCYEAPGSVMTVPLKYEPKVGDTWAEVKYGSKVSRYLPIEN